jgi:hypothetical protein
MQLSNRTKLDKTKVLRFMLAVHPEPVEGCVPLQQGLRQAQPNGFYNRLAQKTSFKPFGLGKAGSFMKMRFV